MPRKSDNDLTKHTLNLVKGDFRRLQELYPDMGAAVVIRNIIRSFVAKIDSGGRKPKVDVDIKL